MYEVELTTSAAKQLAKIASRDRFRIVGAVELLATNPFPPASAKLKGRDGWRVRVGDYRIIYVVSQAVLTVVVIKIGHRQDVDHGKD